MAHNLLDTGQLYRRFDETVHDGARLGRHLWLDARSLAFMVENDLEAMSGKIASKSWARRTPILDQGQLGSCTGNAGTGVLGTDPLYDVVGREFTLDEEYAVSLYSDATRVDGYAGTYPPNDSGSSGLAICKVLKTRGLARSYRHARTPHGLLRLLQDGPVLYGTPWYESWFTPDAQGFIDANAQWGDVAGGHEVECVGCELDSADLFSSVLTFVNSWGTGWGDAGYFRMRLRTYEQVSGADVKQVQP